MRHIIVSAADKDNEIQVEIEFTVPQEFSWDLCRLLGLRTCVPKVCAFANIHRSTGPPETWTFHVREKSKFPWEQHVAPF